MANLKYIFGSILLAPTLPLMYLQGKRIKASVPKLPEATGIAGTATGKSPTKRVKMLAIGESTIAGVGVQTHDEGFTGTLAAELANHLNISIDWKVYARSGYTAKRVTDKILPKISETEIDLIVVGLGGNDAFKLRSPMQWEKDMRELITHLQTQFPDAYLLLTCMPPIKEFPAFTPLIKMTIGNLVELFGRELATLTQEFEGVFYHDFILSMKGWNDRFGLTASPADYFSDGVHPSKLAYQTWAKFMAEEVSRDLKFKTFLKIQ